MMTLEQRIRPDRRSRPTQPLSRYALFGGRRRRNRRQGDRRSYYVDHLGAPTWFLLLAIFAFQVLDAFMTLAHIQRGGIELNPVMGALLHHGNGAFLGVKLGVSAAGLWFLGIHKNFPFVKSGLAILFVLFLGVVGWQCFLALRLV
jgi:hypothetical protein